MHGCTGTRVHGQCGTQLTVYAKIQQLLLIFGLKCLAVKAQVSSLKMICKAYECLQLVCLWRSIKLLFHSTRFLSFSNILMNIRGFVILQRLFFFLSKMMTFSMSKDNICVGRGQQLARAVSPSKVSFTHHTQKSNLTNKIQVNYTKKRHTTSYIHCSLK